MKPGIKNHPVCGKGGNNIGEPQMEIAFFIHSQGIGQLVFMEIQEDGRTFLSGKGLEISKIHHIRNHNGIIDGKIFDLIHKIKGSPPHPPFPEPGRKRDKGDIVAGVGLKTQGKVFVGAAEKRFEKQNFHAFLIAWPWGQ